MKRFTIIAAAVAVLASAQFAAARGDNNTPAPANYGEQVEVKAGNIFSGKELSQRGYKADDLVTVTKAPKGPYDPVNANRG